MMKRSTLLFGILIIVTITVVGFSQSQNINISLSGNQIAAKLPSVFGDPEEYKCGEKVEFKKADITIGNPKSSFTVTREYSWIPQEHAYLRVPITIKAKKDIKLKAKNFKSEVVEEQDDCMPEKLELKKGKTFKGTLCIEWDCAGATAYHEAPEMVQCKKRGFKGIWKFSYDKSMRELKSPDDIEGILPNIPIKATVTVESIDYLGAASGNSYDREVALMCKEGLFLTTVISGDDLEKWEGYKEKGTKLKIEGILRNITQKSGGSEPIITRCAFISAVVIK